MLKDTLRERFADAALAAQQDNSLPTFDLPAVEIQRPKQPEHGDYSTNIAMVLAASVRNATGEKSNPRQIAQAILDHLPASDLIGSVELAGPGFINIRLADEWIQQQVATILLAGESVGNTQRGAGQRWQVEYVSANPTGPIHYGGARNAALGDALANVLKAAGYSVQREFYINDGGTQIEHFAATLYARYAQLLGRDVPMPEDGYLGEYMTVYAQRLMDRVGDAMLDLPQEEAIAQIKPVAREMVVADLKEEVAGMGVHFDNWFSEQSLYDEGRVQQALDYLKERGELAERDGAVWFLASNYPKNEKDEVVVRSNGAPTYFASDIAYHYDKFLRRKFDRVVNVWAVDHQGHVARMAAMMQAFGLDPDRLVILMYDLVKLIRDGEEVKLSKRAGNLISIADVVEEVGADAMRFNLLTRAPESTIEFDLDLAVEQSNENPVYYVQYSHARICSILARAEQEGLLKAPSRVIQAAIQEPIQEELGESSAPLLLLTHPAELTLLRKMLELEEQIDLAVDKLSPHNLTHYAMELARVFNAFYRDCKVVDPAQPELSHARLQLCRASRIVLAKVLSLLGVGAPESM